MTSRDFTTDLEENREDRNGFLRFFTSMPLALKLVILVIVALIPRLIVFLQPQIITNDGVLYIQMAKQFSEGRYAGTPGSYFSLYPLLIFLVQKLVGDWELSGQLISIGLGTLTVIPVFLLGRSLYTEKVGLLSALFYIVLPNSIKFDTQVIRDPTFWFFMVSTIWLVWEANKSARPSLFCLASISAGLGALTRVEGFFLWVVLGLYIVVRMLKAYSAKRKALNLALFFLFFPLLVSIVFVSSNMISGQKAFSEMRSFSFNFITAHARMILKPQDPIEAMGGETYDSLPVISRDSLELASRHRFVLATSEVVYKFVKSANFLLVLIVLGFWKRRREGLIHSDEYPLFILIALFVMSVFYARQIYYFSTRHGLTLVLPCLFLGGHGLKSLIEVSSQVAERVSFGSKKVQKILPLIIPLFFFLCFLLQGFSGKGSDKALMKQVGLWLKKNGYEGSVIMGPRDLRRMAFYANGRFLEMPDSSGKAMESIQEGEVRVVVIESCGKDRGTSEFISSLSEEGFVLIRSIEEGKDSCLFHIYGAPQTRRSSSSESKNLARGAFERVWSRSGGYECLH